MQETRIRYLGGEDPLEKEMATHSRILYWEIPWTEEPGALPPTVRGSRGGHKRIGHNVANSGWKTALHPKN